MKRIDKQDYDNLKAIKDDFLLIFDSEWCVACKSLKLDLKKLPYQIEDLYIIDEEEDDRLNEIFNIEYLPTLVIIDNVKHKYNKIEGNKNIVKYLKNIYNGR